MDKFTAKDLRGSGDGALSISDQMSLEFGGRLSPEGAQFISDRRSLEFGGPLSSDAATLLSNERCDEFGGRKQPLSPNSIYTEEIGEDDTGMSDLVLP